MSLFFSGYEVINRKGSFRCSISWLRAMCAIMESEYY